MKNKMLLIVPLVIIAIAAGGWFLINNKSTDEMPNDTKNENILTNQVQPTSIPEDRLWKDQAGFTFNYDPALVVSQDQSDAVSYSNITISDSTKAGTIKILAVDTKYKSVSDWVTKEPSIKQGVAEDTYLGGLEAKKVKLADGKTIIGTIDEKILFTIENVVNSGAPAADKSAWQTKADKIIASFAFYNPLEENSTKKVPAESSSGADSGGIIESEEVLE